LGDVFKLGLQVRVVKLGWSSLGVHAVGCCEFLVSIFRRSKPPHHVKGNPLQHRVHMFEYNSGVVKIEIQHFLTILNSLAKRKDYSSVVVGMTFYISACPRFPIH
jgi:hypothetical protein